ncbi:hypothetical protein [Mycobacterium attenuatum]|uniref:hypothetical protein n=1 Tax=Mycobacterium attenuatum TaxID=2341086 RepID=UPI001459FFB3|nr:hypothetical protein [Mycobacterium attenuatum]
MTHEQACQIFAWHAAAVRPADTVHAVLAQHRPACATATTRAVGRAKPAVAAVATVSDCAGITALACDSHLGSKAGHARMRPNLT